MLMKSASASIVSTFLVLSATQFALAQKEPAKPTSKEPQTEPAKPTSKEPQTEAAKPTSKEDLKKKTVATISCEDFNGVVASFKPTVVAWVAGFKQGDKKPDAVTLDIQGIENVTPLIVDACKKDPKASFWTKAEDELKKIF